VFEHQAFIFTYRQQTCSGTWPTVQWDIPNSSNAFKATTRYKFWQCLRETVGTVLWAGSTIQISGICTIHSYSLCVVVYRFHVFEPTGNEKQCTRFPLCVYSVRLPLFSWCCVSMEFPLLVNTPAALQWYQIARQRSCLGDYLFYGNKIGKIIFVYWSIWIDSMPVDEE
jgi:hypothetical protein